MIEKVEKGKIITAEKITETSHLDWNKHASCEGVFLKHIVTGQLTDGKFSCHLVKVRAGYRISEHIHANHWELHEIIAGEAMGYLVNKIIPYQPGTTVIIPEGQPHKIIAGEQDLYLLAKFIPAFV